MDIVKNPFIDVDIISATDFYDFKLGPIMFMDDMNIYTIDFNQNKAVTGMM